MLAYQLAHAEGWIRLRDFVTPNAWDWRRSLQSL